MADDNTIAFIARALDSEWEWGRRVGIREVVDRIRKIAEGNIFYKAIYRRNIDALVEQLEKEWGIKDV